MEEYKVESESRSNESNTRINVLRFINKLDSYYRENDMDAISKHLNFWENEAKVLNDAYGLTAVLNEKLRYAQYTDNRELLENTVNELLPLIENTDAVSGIQISTNVAEVLKHLSRNMEAIEVFEKAEEIYKKLEADNSCEYATLLNSKAIAYSDLEMYKQAEECLLKAIRILEKDKKHSGDLALSYIGLAHVVWDKDENTDIIEASLDKAVEALEKGMERKDMKYVNILKKCIPSLYAFKRLNSARKFEEVLSTFA